MRGWHHYAARVRPSSGAPTASLNRILQQPGGKENSAMKSMASSLFNSLGLVLLVSAGTAAQTSVDLHRNKYTPAQDVELGRQAAAEVEQQMPLLRDEVVSAYVNRIGQRLVRAIPPSARSPSSGTLFRSRT